MSQGVSEVDFKTISANDRARCRGSFNTIHTKHRSCAFLQRQPNSILQQPPSLPDTHEYDHPSPARAPTLCRGWNGEDGGMRGKIETGYQQGTVHAFRQGFSAIKCQNSTTGVVFSDSRHENGKRTSIERLGKAHMSLRMSELCRHASMM